MPLESLLDIKEAAARLRKSVIWLQRWLRRNPADRFGEPFYMPAGRVKLFYEKDIRRIEAHLREEFREELERTHRRRPRYIPFRQNSGSLQEALDLAAQRTREQAAEKRSRSPYSADVQSALNAVERKLAEERKERLERRAAVKALSAKDARPGRAK